MGGVRIAGRCQQSTLKALETSTGGIVQSTVAEKPVLRRVCDTLAMPIEVQLQVARRGKVRYKDLGRQARGRCWYLNVFHKTGRMWVKENGNGQIPEPAGFIGVAVKMRVLIIIGPVQP